MVTTIRGAGLLLVLATVAGCGGAHSAPRGEVGQVVENDNADMVSDPCALNMQDIAGALLIYYNAHNRLPEKLQSLPASPQMDYFCPTSRQAYVYVPMGLAVPNQSRLLVLYDATPAHHGTRWGITLDPSHYPVTTDVIRLDQPVLNVYLKGQ